MFSIQVRALSSNAYNRTAVLCIASATISLARSVIFYPAWRTMVGGGMSSQKDTMKFTDTWCCAGVGHRWGQLGTSLWYAALSTQITIARCNEGSNQTNP
ncbi:unnamed protein product [Ectocarpus sp. 4 AP-2014]